MKSKLLLIIVFAALGLNLAAQPLHWKESLADPLKTSTITKETVLITEGTSSLKYTYTDPGTVFFISDTFAVTSGAEYHFTGDLLDNDVSGRISIRIYYFNQRTNIGTSSSQYMAGGRLTSANTVKQATWQTITMPSGTLPTTTPLGAVVAFVVLNMNPATAPAWTGSATFLSDNFKYTEGTGTTNLLTNPGFEDWAAPVIVPNSTLLNWNESLVGSAISGR